MARRARVEALLEEGVAVDAATNWSQGRGF